MKKYAIILLLLLFAFCSPDKKKSGEVYVCDSSTSVAYHAYENCKGLNKCTHAIVFVTKEEAVNMGKRACRICY